jgi:uncharacterized protein YndB with AHSA1/START domain
MTDASRMSASVARTAMLIRRPVAEVFEAFVNPETITRFWFTRSSGRLERGTTVEWTWDMYGFSIPVVVRELVPDERIVVEWPGAGGTPTTVAFSFSARPDGTTFVDVSNSGFTAAGGELVEQVAGAASGFSFVLAGAKAWLEHGIRLNLVADRYPDGH